MNEVTFEPGVVLQVLEIFAHNYWEPFAIFKNPSEEAMTRAKKDAEFRLKPLRYREGTTDDWGGPEKTLERMNRFFSNDQN